ncbi:MAG: hypothetical protein JO005_06285, partial [Gammaproteobacteria bacterium]|nr:hypothetical protein [Gammaproteobacteria bacterium]
MNHSAEPRESAAPAAGTAARALRPLLRLGVPLAVLAGLLLLGAQLITARIPQQRAALEQLLREQTGLTVSFETLTVHWGWYGPEARFHQVTLAAPGQPPLLHAPRLGVTLDLWRSARSGHLEAGHIALFGPEIELALPGGGSTRASGSTDPLAEPLRRLRDWRGGRIDLWRGTLRLADARGSALALGIEHAELRRLGARWSADAHLTLSPELGSRAHVVLRLDEAGGGTLALEGRQLNLAGWRPLATRLGAAWPLAGEAELSLNASFLRGRLQRAEADLDARSLAWSLRENGVPLEVRRLQGRWRLHRQGDGWELEAGRLALGAGADLAARLSLDAAGSVRGELHNLPLEELVALARWQGWPEAPVHLSGRVPQLSFIWDAARPRGQRLTGRAELEELRIADGADDHALQGLRAHLDATEELLRLDLEGERAQLTGADGVREPLGVSARLTLAADARGWQLAAEPLELRRAGGGLSGSVLLRGAANGAPQLDARVTVHELDLAPFAARFAAHYAPLGRLSAGRIEHGGIEVHERLDAQALQRTLSARTRGTFELHGLALEGGGAWPTLQRLDAQLALRGEQLSARARGGAVQGFAVDSARLSWHYGTAAAHLQAHLRGRAEEALGWLRAQPSLANYLPPAADFTASGALLLDLDLTGSATQLDPRSRVTAVLDGVSLQALAGLPPLQSLRGVLRLRGGSLQGTASGRWLEGPVNLSAATRAARPVPVVSLTARGAAELRGLLPADSRGAPPVSGSSEWTAQLTFAPEAGAFTVSADAPLTGVVSHLPEPLGKSPASALAAHLEAQGANGTAQVRFRLGDRVGGVLALARGAAGWRIERGAVACGAVAPALPTEAMLALSGSTPQLDLPAYLALWRQQSRAALLPPITAHLSARELLLGAVYRDAELSAALGQEGGSLELRGPGLTGSLIW